MQNQISDKIFNDDNDDEILITSNKNIYNLEIRDNCDLNMIENSDSEGNISQKKYKIPQYNKQKNIINKQKNINKNIYHYNGYSKNFKKIIETQNNINKLPPSYFPSACVCGHNHEYREFLYPIRNKIKNNNLTIKPKLEPIELIYKNLNDSND